MDPAVITAAIGGSGSLIGGIPATQEVIDYCGEHKIFPVVETVNAGNLNEVWEKVVAKKRPVIDM